MKDFDILWMTASLWRQLSVLTIVADTDLTVWSKETLALVHHIEETAELDGISLPTVAALSEALTSARAQLARVDQIQEAGFHHFIGHA